MVLLTRANEFVFLLTLTHNNPKMKNLLSLVLLIIALGNKAQTLTQTYNEPKVGDYDISWRMDTSAFAGGLPLSVTGSNTVWNFTSLAASSVALTNYLSPSAVPSASSYAGCNMVQSDNGTFTFLKSVTTPSQQTEIVGLDIGLGSVNLSNSAIIAKYPVSFGYNQTDQVSGSFTSTITNGTCSGNIVTKADGTGTLNLPAGVIVTDVLRLKTVLTITLTAFFIPIATARQTYYSYYHSSKKFPVLNIIYTELSTTGGSPTITAAVNGNYFVVMGLSENSDLSKTELTIFPNPATDKLNLEMRQGLKNATLEIYNGLAQKVYSGAFTNELDLSQLEEGVYYLSVRSENGIVCKKFIKD